EHRRRHRDLVDTPHIVARAAQATAELAAHLASRDAADDAAGHAAALFAAGGGRAAGDLGRRHGGNRGRRCASDLRPRLWLGGDPKAFFGPWHHDWPRLIDQLGDLGRHRRLRRRWPGTTAAARRWRRWGGLADDERNDLVLAVGDLNRRGSENDE